VDGTRDDRKRKINSGLISKLSMSMEKEVALEAACRQSIGKQSSSTTGDSRYVNQVAQVWCIPTPGSIHC
jgi:hypothetical protein